MDWWIGLTINKMISNMVGLAAGLEISKALGASVGPGKANWAAASYPFVFYPASWFRSTTDLLQLDTRNICADQWPTWFCVWLSKCINCRRHLVRCVVCGQRFQYDVCVF